MFDTLSRPVETVRVYPEDVVAREYGDLGWFSRLVLRTLFPKLARATKDLHRRPRSYVNVPVYRPQEQPGPFTRWADKHLG